jgi:hypothetical protein
LRDFLQSIDRNSTFRVRTRHGFTKAARRRRRPKAASGWGFTRVKLWLRLSTRGVWIPS